VAERVRMMRNYGQRKKYDHVYLAWNRRLDTLQAAVLRVKLAYLDAWNDARRRHSALYYELLADTGLERPIVAPDRQHVFHLYVVQAASRGELLEYLAEHGIQAGIHYPIPIHLQAAYHECGLGSGSYPISERIAGRLLSLPMYPELSDQQIERVAKTAREFAQLRKGR
jgi:dTDP-4-amino-4,6-dideoxygalactose transaminase